MTEGKNMTIFHKEAQQLKNKIDDVLKRHNLVPEDNIYYGEEHGDGSLEINIEKDSLGWHWKEIERAYVNREKFTADKNEILYWIIKQSSRGEAGKGINWTSKSKRKDPRKTFFNNHVKIMKLINSEWGTRLESEYNQIIK